MRSTHQRLAVLLLLGLGGTALAAQAPADATAKCKDGTYSTAKTSRGRCSGHGGVAQLLNTTSTSTSSAATTSTGGNASTSTAAGGVPAHATFQCKDGTYSTAKTERGACSRHGGVDHPVTASSGAAAAPAAAAPAAASGEATHGKAPTIARPASAPATATAKCKDGTYSESKQHSGACSHHGGVVEWYQ